MHFDVLRVYDASIAILDKSIALGKAQVMQASMVCISQFVEGEFQR